ncbi:hypothetical protein HBB16_21045 [Pseudonocardia sp. MCCB 268]|nr:hypothetical protein [Pseudonocardia cytotoxica]
MQIDNATPPNGTIPPHRRPERAHRQQPARRVARSTYPTGAAVQINNCAR